MFRLHNDLIVLDLEATAGKDSQGFQTNNCIIDIGAVILDHNLEIRSTFSSLVKPQEPITEFITKLTGITPKMVEDEGDFGQVGQEFLQWIQEHSGSPKKVRLAAWGNYFDIPLLRKNYQDFGKEFPFSGTALDVKTLGFLWLSLSGRRTDKTNLPTLAAELGVKPQGAYHRAITDAQVTADVLVQLWHQLQGVFVPGKEGEAFAHYSLEKSVL